MKKLFLVFLLGIMGVIISSCESEDDPVTPGETGSVYITSTPEGAQIWIHGANSGKVTPDTLTDLDVEAHDITLKLAQFLDTTFTVSVVANQTATRNITLTEAINATKFISVRLWETAGTTELQPSGLDLSTGMAYGISGNDRVNVDIYYSSDGQGSNTYLVQSADLGGGMTRVTKFRVGSGATLDDGANSPLQNSGTWANFMDDRESNYVFLYDNDGHYSKVLITDFDPGSPGISPGWVELTYWYNNVANDERF